MTDVIMVSYGTQALALAHHTYDLALLVGSQLRLGPKFDASFSGSGAPTIGTSEDAGSFVLRKGRQESQNSLPERRGQIQPLDALRGIAAMGVVLFHAAEGAIFLTCFRLFPNPLSRSSAMAIWAWRYSSRSAASLS